ncbi:MAG: 50S ribosomal protein L10 [Clostridia bacterium]|nr:50S ribosomal protein L10 [Clostridia bacterium]
MSANLEAKKKLVADIQDQLKDAKSILFVDYRGITVAEDTELRKSFREAGVTYKVFKNRLLMKALENIGVTGYDAKEFEGTTAVAFSADEVAPARIFCETAEKLKKMSVKFSIVNGEIMDKSQTEAMAKIPSKPVLISMLLNVLQGPMSSMARALNEIAKKQA